MLCSLGLRAIGGAGSVSMTSSTEAVVLVASSSACSLPWIPEWKGTQMRLSGFVCATWFNTETQFSLVLVQTTRFWSDSISYIYWSTWFECMRLTKRNINQNFSDCVQWSLVYLVIWWYLYPIATINSGVMSTLPDNLVWSVGIPPTPHLLQKLP